MECLWANAVYKGLLVAESHSRPIACVPGTCAPACAAGSARLAPFRDSPSEAVCFLLVAGSRYALACLPDAAASWRVRALHLALYLERFMRGWRVYYLPYLLSFSGPEGFCTCKLTA